MKPLLLLLAVLAFDSTVQAQYCELIANPDGRKTISLDGEWQTIIDPYESGFYDYRYQASNGGYFQNQKPQSKSDLVEYDFDKSDTLKVPGDWNTQKDQLFFYEGTVWYKKSFDYERRPNTRVFVYFGAANYRADVYLNGTKLGQHEGGFTPFNFEITRFVREKDNFLVVKVDNKRQRDAVPTLMTDWWNYGGLTREVKLIETPETFINDYFIQLKKGSRNHISGWVKLNGFKLNQKINIRIPELGVSTLFTTGGGDYLVIDVTADLKLWSPENPKLYDVIIEAETDRVREQIGFRSLETRGTEILLNGKSIFLRGVSVHEEAPLRSGRAHSREDALTLLGWAKEMGANFVRLAHYPHNEHMVREADRMGILVWSEVPVYWTIQWENHETLVNARQQLTEMIARDKNRAAVVIWSVANETPLSDARLLFLKELIARVRYVDPTRFVSAALERRYVNGLTQMIDDPLGEFLDVLGCNEYIGWYDGLPEKADKISWASKYDKPLIMSEFGGDALYGHHGDELTRWTEEYQESLYKHQIRMLKRIPFLRGTSPWILTDFRSPRRPLPKIQDYWNRKGLISNRGEKKKAFYVMQRWYRELAQAQDAPSFVIDKEDLANPLTAKELSKSGDCWLGGRDSITALVTNKPANGRNIDEHDQIFAPFRAVRKDQIRFLRKNAFFQGGNRDAVVFREAGKEFVMRHI
jgi:beta-glucuronidase